MEFVTNINNNENDGFNTLKNKGILWDLMYKNGTFNGLTQENIENVQNIFEGLVQKYDTSGKDLTTKNKQVLIDMTQQISITKQKINTLPVTANELSNQRRAQFENNLSKRQREFDELVQKPVPKEIDFSDKNDVPIVGNMDQMLEDVIARREHDFNMVTIREDKQPQQQSNIELTIGETIEKTDISTIVPSQNKRVSFTDDNLRQNNIELNTDNGDEGDQSRDLLQLRELIEKVNKKQDEIINMLKRLEH